MFSLNLEKTVPAQTPGVKELSRSDMAAPTIEPQAQVAVVVPLSRQQDVTSTMVTNPSVVNTEDTLRIRLGEILVDKHWITPAQLDEALRQLPVADMSLGEYMVDKGLLTADQVQQALQEQKEKNRDLPTLFARAGLTPQQVRQLELRLEGGEELVDIVRDLGYASDDTVVRVQSTFYGFDPLLAEQARELDLSSYLELGLNATMQPYVPVDYDADTNELSVAISRIQHRNDAENYFRDQFRGLGHPLQNVHFRLASSTTIQGIFFRWFSNTGQTLLERLRECDKTLAYEHVADEDKDNKSLAATRQLAFDMLRHAAYSGASDIHLEKTDKAGYVLFRLDGERQRFAPMSLKTYEALLNLLSSMARVTNEDIMTRLMVEGGFQHLDLGGASDEVRDIFKRWNFRLQFGRAVKGDTVVIRLLDGQSTVADWDQIGWKGDHRAQLEEILSTSDGLLVITGPTGSGKTTTLYAGLRRLDADGRSIQSLERPVEFTDPRWKQYEIPNTVTEQDGGKEILKGMLRNDPDVILMGEVRDAEACQLLLRASNTGHLVLTTFHTKTSSRAISQFRAWGIPSEMVASELKAIIAQRLVRRLCGHCRQPDTRHETRQALSTDRRLLNPQTTLYRASVGGCALCNHTGYRGRRMVYEVLRVTPQIRLLIEEEKPITEIERAAFSNSEQNMWRHGLELVAAGVTSIDEVRVNVPRED